ncbi:hypothetical protein BC343_06040 [Mucilaginibacter pedocola]|uniref:DUF4905 domain-containing protein n=2 Tax=Mucilaginibacter pedocola TaxID=1792845 RepID=A0A1S9PFI1_9SPHI|nr:hypothetical protein BC343_06040 [Mucilaginibacter pedocola]
MLQPLLSHQFAATIWRMEIDELTDTLVLEVRNETEKQVSFASVSLTTGQLNFEGFTTDERWLAGVDALYNNVALLHYYKHENGPEHKGITAIDAGTSAPVWNNYSLALSHLSINGPIVYNTALQPKKLVLIDAQTGQTLRNASPEDKPLANSIVIPSLLPASDFVEGSLPEAPFGNIVHSLNHNGYRIVSLHTLKNGGLQQRIYILDGETIRYTDLLNEDIQKLQPEAFVIHKNALVYVKNRTNIIVLAL